MIEYYRPSLLYQNLLLMSEFDQEGLSIQSFLMAIPVSFLLRHSQSLFRLFLSFQTNITMLQ